MHFQLGNCTGLGSGGIKTQPLPSESTLPPSLTSQTPWTYICIYTYTWVHGELAAWSLNRVKCKAQLTGISDSVGSICQFMVDEDPGRMNAAC